MHSMNKASAGTEAALYPAARLAACILARTSICQKNIYRRRRLRPAQQGAGPKAIGTVLA